MLTCQQTRRASVGELEKVYSNNKNQGSRNLKHIVMVIVRGHRENECTHTQNTAHLFHSDIVQDSNLGNGVAHYGLFSCIS